LIFAIFLAPNFYLLIIFGCFFACRKLFNFTLRLRCKAGAGVFFGRSLRDGQNATAPQDAASPFGAPKGRLWSNKQPMFYLEQGVVRESCSPVLASERSGERRQLMKTSNQSLAERGMFGFDRKTQREIRHEQSKLDRLSKQRQRLLRLRDTLFKEIRQLTTEACEENPSYSMHPADAATDSFDRDLVLGLATFEQDAVYEIDAALKRIEDGTYGVCELTDQQIPWN
jgi:RNA polymerase-binding transcription factor DksA